MKGKKEPNPSTSLGVKSPIAQKEEETLKFWQDNKIFEKSLEKDSPAGNFVFYDGPPFATGLPHYGHILASAIKDAIPRYQTMLGKHVERVWGWDCHGLPIENIVEKDLGISGKKEIEEYGIEKFNAHARSKVLEYVHDWKRTVERIGRWVDFDGSYKTMDNSFMESVLWAFKEMYEKKLVYESTRVLPYCPRCETPIANSEIAMDNSYKDITDISVYPKFELTDEPGTFILAWTTTPWTLPGNFALAVNPEIEYVKVGMIDKESGIKSNYILAKDRLEAVLKEKEYEIIGKVKASDLIGRSYKPLFDYFKKLDFKNKENAWKIYAADFVKTDEGTGIVHMAPGYGEEDLELAKKENIPFIHHVDHTGRFTAAVTDFAGLPVKPKGDHQSSDILIIKKLAHDRNLFAKEKIIHSYPHCFRCETPLYYYAIPAWFIDIQKSKPRFLELNEKIHWIPEHLKEGRFKKSAEGAPDWNISRNRYWASPLPIWKCEKCKSIEVIGSVADIKKHTKRNTYYLMRHGEADNNVLDILSGKSDDPRHLTDKGREQIMTTSAVLKDKNIDIIFHSPFIRTTETAELIKKTIDFKGETTSDDRLHEFGFGDLSGKKIEALQPFFHLPSEVLTKALPNGENLNDIRKRVAEFIFDIDSKYENKNILIVTHDTPATALFSVSRGDDDGSFLKIWDGRNVFIGLGEMMELPFAQIPHNERYELDFHRPYIDEITFPCKCGERMQRIPEVMDGWFESGSMSFAQKHYPFENKEWFHRNFPSQFVAEYIAQTRTWFYYMHTVSTILFDSIPFENVVTTGTILAEDGQKMSKSKANFPDPWIIFDKYSVDALRFYLLSSPLMKSEDLNFSEKGVDEVNKRIILRLKNVVSFYELYKTENSSNSKQASASSHVLDQWILSRLGNIAREVTEALDQYEIDKALSPFDKFVDDLSTWYLRRSRDRFKNEDQEDKENALSTIRFVLQELSKLMAPFMPFIAEDLYQRVKMKDGKESVHLEGWPAFAETSAGEGSLLKEMEEVRKIVSLALEVRAKAGIKVRQPLSELKVRQDEFEISENAGLLELIKDEVNVKEVVPNAAIEAEVYLNIEIGPELKEEGQMRELTRSIQDLRKEEGFQVGEKADLAISTSAEGKALVDKFKDEISKTTGLSEIKFAENDGEEIKIDNLTFKLKLEK